jgi:hypothetical protein
MAWVTVNRSHLPFASRGQSGQTVPCEPIGHSESSFSGHLAMAEQRKITFCDSGNGMIQSEDSRTDLKRPLI